jgi:hypothetical protein
MTRRERFALAFYDQAKSDWDVYNSLAKLRLARCHELHYLQMACEKLAKAYALRKVDADVDSVTEQHVAFHSFINAYLRSPAVAKAYAGQDARHRELCKTSGTIAREIEKLAPAVDRKAFPENAEYPWERGDTVLTPCKYSFPALSLLEEPGGRAFLRLVAEVVRDYTPTA